MAHHRTDVIDEAFRDDLDLARRIHSARRTHPTNGPLFVDIAEFICGRRKSTHDHGHDIDEEAKPSTKKRKLENGAVAKNEEKWSERKIKVIFEAKDISFSIPTRRKMHLEIIEDVPTIPGNSTLGHQIRTRNAVSGELEHEAPFQSFQHALRLPVPEKIQKQYNFVLLPNSTLCENSKASVLEGNVNEPLLWTTNEGTHKSVFLADTLLEEDMQSQDSTIVEQVIQKFLEGTPAARLIGPEDAEFSSAISEAHRKGEKAYHVKAFRGSKEGYLFFLATGIFFGFKKPLAFIPFDEIYSISYTSILQRTFNLNVAVQPRNEGDMIEQEFSMLDQAEFASIDSYIKRHQLQDSSLAESRKAQKLALNGTRGGGANDAIDETEQLSELHKAQVELEDMEDEEEEDYEPESDDSSSGSGESGEEADLGDGELIDRESDLVTTELGSEAEDLIPDSGSQEPL